MAQMRNEAHASTQRSCENLNVKFFGNSDRNPCAALMCPCSAAEAEYIATSRRTKAAVLDVLIFIKDTRTGREILS